MTRYAKDGTEYPECPTCKSDEWVTKNGGIERKGQIFQMYRCGKCGRSW